MKEREQKRANATNTKTRMRRQNDTRSRAREPFRTSSSLLSRSDDDEDDDKSPPSTSSVESDAGRRAMRTPANDIGFRTAPPLPVAVPVVRLAVMPVAAEPVVAPRVRVLCAQRAPNVDDDDEVEVEIEGGRLALLLLLLAFPPKMDDGGRATPVADDEDEAVAFAFGWPSD
jgi:hypothetical protein